MPEFATLADVIRFNDKNVQDYGVTNLFKKTPALSALSADTASNGVVDIYTREMGLPDAAFRTFDHGAIDSVGTGETVTVTLKILAQSSTVDKKKADSYTKGGPEAYIQEFGINPKIESGLIGAERQLFYGNGLKDDGTSNGNLNPYKADGFSGLADVDFLRTKAGAMVIDAGSTTANVNSDIWLLCTGKSDVQVVLGQDGIVTVDESVVQRVVQSIDANTNLAKTFPGYYTPIEGLVGIRVGSIISAVRIVNVGKDDHKATDALIHQGLSLLESFGKVPNMIVMSARSKEQIRLSRTAVNATGEAAATVTQISEVPLIATPAISNTLALVA